MENLTEKQQQIFDFIKKEIKTKGIPPSIREICKATNLSSTSSVHLHLETLEKKGYINRSHSKTRHIEILEEGFYTNNAAAEYENFTNVPIVGTVAAGIPVLAEENIEGFFTVPTNYLKNSKAFMLKIKGNSMINAGIFDGDLVLVNQQPSAENNEIVIALIDDSATCKRFFKEDNQIRLQPENDAFKPIIVNEDITILGKVIGLFRSIR